MVDPTPGDSDADFEVARRAVDLGWLTREQVEVALLEVDSRPDSSLLSHLPLTPGQRRELEAPAPYPPSDLQLVPHDSGGRVAHYQLVERLGSGGMGKVFKAWDTRLLRWVALKFMKTLDNAGQRACFEQEARLAAGLSHPNIAAIYEIGEQERAPYIAMQFIEGRTLADAQPGLKPREAARIVRDTARAVAFAHGCGVIHRDLKPSNVMLDQSGRVYVMDFGLAIRSQLSDSHLRPKGVTGTLEYISPEQAKGDMEDARTDVHGLGGTLYDLLTGSPPNPGFSGPDILRRLAGAERLRPRALNRNVDVDLELIVLRCLEESPNHRYSSAKELGEDLDRYLDGDPIRARRPTLTYRLRMRLAKRKALLLTAVAAMLLAFPLSMATIRNSSSMRAEHEVQLRNSNAIQSKIMVLARDIDLLWVEYLQTNDQTIRNRIDTLHMRIQQLQELQEEMRNY